MTVRTYWALETTATLRLLGGARGAGAPTGEERGGAYRVATRTACCLKRSAYITFNLKTITLIPICNCVFIIMDFSHAALLSATG